MMLYVFERRIYHLPNLKYNVMMRIALIGPTYPFRGGISHYTTLLTRELRREHEVLLVSFKRQYPSWLFPGKSDREPADGAVRESAEYLIDSLNPLTWLKTVNRITRFAPDVVVMQWWVPFWAVAWGGIGRMLKRKLPSAKLIYIVHNALPHEPSPIDKQAVKFVLAPADKLIAQARSEADKLQTLFPNKAITIVPHPSYAELGAEPSDEPLSVPPDKPLLLFCGLIRPYKGLDILLDALPLILAKQDVHLGIVGEMWGGGAEYFEQIDRLGIEKHVTVVNEYVSNARLGQWVRSADVVILPYRSATQSGIVQLAFGLGTPVITTRVGGLVDVVEDGVTGLLVEPNSTIAIADAVTRYLETPFNAIVSQTTWSELAAAISD